MRRLGRPYARSSRGLGRVPNASRGLLDAVGIVIWAARIPSLRRSFVSRHAERLFGYPRSRWIQEPRFWLEHIHPEDRKRVLAETRAYLSDRPDSAVLSYRFIAADGRAVWVRDALRLAMAAGTGPRLCGAMSDVSDLRRRSEARPLWKSRELIRLPLGRRLRSQRARAGSRDTARLRP